MSWGWGICGDLIDSIGHCPSQNCLYLGLSIIARSSMGEGLSSVFCKGERGNLGCGYLLRWLDFRKEHVWKLEMGKFPLELFQTVLRKSSHAPVWNGCSAPSKPCCFGPGIFPSQCFPHFQDDSLPLLDKKVWVLFSYWLYPKPTVIVIGQSQRMFLEGSPGKGKRADLSEAGLWNFLASVQPFSVSRWNGISTPNSPPGLQPVVPQHQLQGFPAPGGGGQLSSVPFLDQTAMVTASQKGCLRTRTEVWGCVLSKLLKDICMVNDRHVAYAQ